MQLGAPTRVPTERDELATHFNVPPDVLRASPTCRMRSIVHSDSAPRAMSAAPLCASVSAMAHPQLPGVMERCKSLGYSFAVDTSLREKCTSDAPRTSQALTAHLNTIGAYFSPTRRVVGIAEDSAWYEVVHEMVHVRFDARGSDALQQHREQWRSRGYSLRVAEEMVCREHELFAITHSGAPPWRWTLRALLVWDSALVERQRDLESTSKELQQHRRDIGMDRFSQERRRVRLLRGLVTGPHARVAYVAALGLAVTAVASSFLRRLQSRYNQGVVS